MEILAYFVVGLLVGWILWGGQSPGKLPFQTGHNQPNPDGGPCLTPDECVFCLREKIRESRRV